jgi:hypothetical protein
MTLAALIVTVPGATPVTVASGVPGAPLTVTRAIVTFDVSHPTSRLGIAFPNASVPVATIRTVPPTAIDAVAGVSRILARGPGPTVTTSVAVTPSIDAVIVARPPTLPLTVVDADGPAVTAAIDGSDDVHVAGLPGIALPAASNGVAVNEIVCPMITKSGPAIVTRTTGRLETTTVTDPETPPTVAVIVTVPGETPVIVALRSVPCTVAIDGSLERHVTT